MSSVLWSDSAEINTGSLESQINMIKTELMSSENSLGKTLNVTGIGMRTAYPTPLPTGYFIQHSQKATTCNRHLKNQYIILIPVITKILHFRISDDSIVAKDKRMSLLSNNRNLND